MKHLNTWYNFNSKSNEIDIFEEIGGWGIQATDFINELKSFEGKGKIVVNINSGGGSVFDGIAIYNALKDKGNIHVKVSGLAASAASVIAMAGSTIEMGEGSFMMIHKPWVMAMGDSDDLIKQAETLDKIQSQMNQIYFKANRSELSIDEISNMVDAETWMGADEAVEKGFADKVANQVKVAALFNLDKFEYKNLPNNYKSSAMSEINEDKVADGVFSRLWDKITASAEKPEDNSGVEIKNLTTELGEIKNKYEAVKTDLENAATATEEIKNSLVDASATIEARDTSITALNAEIAELKAKLAEPVGDSLKPENGSDTEVKNKSIFDYAREQREFNNKRNKR